MRALGARWVARRRGSRCRSHLAQRLLEGTRVLRLGIGLGLEQGDLLLQLVGLRGELVHVQVLGNGAACRHLRDKGQPPTQARDPEAGRGLSGQRRSGEGQRQVPSGKSKAQGEARARRPQNTCCLFSASARIRSASDFFTTCFMMRMSLLTSWSAFCT